MAIDKHADNLDILRELHPEVAVIQADLAEPGAWEDAFAGAQVVVQLHAQITGKHHAETSSATTCRRRERVLDACRRHARSLPGAHQLVGGQFRGR